MFYLVSFLTLLTSLLIYMMDPAPVQMRRDLDTRSAEGYIVGFINQHQAARDYLNQWLGRVYYLNSNIEEIANVASGIVKNVPLASALSLPAEMEDFLSLQTQSVAAGSTFVTERGTQATAGDSVSFLQFTNDVSVGSYLSALVCVDTNDTLKPCYQYMCKDASGNIALSGVGAQCGAGTTVVGAKFANNVRPYVVTYSDNKDSNPEWWYYAGKNKALRHELWRRAMAHRTHAAYNCGIISQAADVCQTDNGYYKRKSGDRIEAMPGTMTGAADESRYCIHNGSRCMRLLPKAMESFLEAVVSTRCDGGGVGGVDKSLSGVFFCMNEVKNPYEKVATPKWHFDGIDNKALGAKERATGTNADLTWYSSGTDMAEVAWHGSWGNPSGYGIGSEYAVEGASAGIPMPFDYAYGTPFTLTVIVHYGNESGLRDNWFISAEADNQNTSHSQTPVGNFGMFISYTDEIFFCAQDSIAGSSDCHNINAGLSGADLAYFVRGVHSWTIVHKGGTIELYHNGQKYPEFKNITAGGTGERIWLGKLGVGIGSVRYYNSALSEEQIKKNFEIDSKRYGIGERPIRFLPAGP